MVKRIVVRGDGSWSVEPNGDWVSSRNYDALAAELVEWQRMRNEAMAQAEFNRNGIEALAAELAGLRREHQRVWEERKALEAALRKAIQCNTSAEWRAWVLEQRSTLETGDVTRGPCARCGTTNDIHGPACGYSVSLGSATVKVPPDPSFCLYCGKPLREGCSTEFEVETGCEGYYAHRKTKGEQT